MKTTLVLAFLLSTSALAADPCPNLAGSYPTCTNAQGSLGTISQTELDGITTYTFEKGSYVADGKSHPLAPGWPTNYTATCKDGTLTLYVDGYQSTLLLTPTPTGIHLSGPDGSDSWDCTRQ